MFDKILNYFVIVLALIIILVLELQAISHGIDGVAFGSAMAGVGTVIGWFVKSLTKRKGGK